MKRCSSLQLIYPIILLGIVLFTGNVMAAGNTFNYITPDETRAKLESGEAMALLDIQVEDEYARHHIKGSLATYAYPVKTDAQKARLDNVISDLSTNTDLIVIICPRGGGGAKRTFEYLASMGINSERMFILEKGQGGWPYLQFIVSN